MNAQTQTLSDLADRLDNPQMDDSLQGQLVQDESFDYADGGDAQFATAMAAAQAEMTAAKFDSENPHFHSKFASLASVMDVARVAARHGIAYLQTIEQDHAEGIRCVTTLLHRSGQQRMSWSPWFMPTKFDAFGVAGATTYARRIGLSTALGISGGEDLDLQNERDDTPPPDLGLIRKATLAANFGLDSYQKFFLGLNKNERASLLPLHEALKEQAASVPKEDRAEIRSVGHEDA